MNSCSRVAIALTLIGCTTWKPTTSSTTLVIKPEVVQGGFHAQTTINPYTQSDIEHLTIKLFTFDDTEHDLGISKSIPSAQLANTVSFANLRNNTTYRIKAYAYAASTEDANTLISTSDSNSYVDVIVGTDDRPTLTTLKVKLINKPFNGQGTGSVSVTPGNYELAGPEQLEFGLQGSTSIFVGSAASGSVNGTGSQASFNYPYDITMDTNGNFYVADQVNHSIRKITPAGVVSTLAGNGVAAYQDGAGTAASFNTPSSLTIDSFNNLYIADFGNNCVRKVTLDGQVSTFAGSTTPGFSDNTGTSARFKGPRGIAIDAQNILYLADRDNYRIRKITPEQVVSTLAGNGTAIFMDGTGASASMAPMGVTVDAAYNVYFADASNNRVRKITPDGVVTTIAGQGSAGLVNGIGVQARFHAPKALKVDGNGDLYVADQSNQAIRRISPNGTVTTLAGNGTIGLINAYGASSRFNYPSGLYIKGDYIYVADAYNHCIRMIHK